MPAPLHHEYARREEAWPLTACDGRVRRTYVRVGTGYYVPVGRMCDVCGTASMDPDVLGEIAAAQALPRDRAVLREARAAASNRSRKRS